MMEKCTYCGTETRPGEYFCSNCGNNLLSAPPSSKPAPPIMGGPTLPHSPDRWPAHEGEQEMGRKLWGISGTCLMIIALLLGGSALLGLFGVLIQLGGNWSFGLIFLAWGIGVVIINYRARALLRLLISMGLLVLSVVLPAFFKMWIGGAWSLVLTILLLLGSYIAIVLLPPRRRQRAPISAGRILSRKRIDRPLRWR